MTLTRKHSFAVVVAALLVAGCSGMGSSPDGGAGPHASARLESRSGSSVSGMVWFREQAPYLVARYEIGGLKPNSEHGFHIHAVGDCSAANATSAGGHFNPRGGRHGHHGVMARHLGDMPNLRADGEGKARGEVIVADLTVAGEPTSIIGRAVVVHRDPDDFKSQPAGNAGPRIACGKIVAN